MAIIDYLDKHKIADVVNQNESITISSRRMIKDEYIRNIRRNAGIKGGNPNLKQQSQKSDLDKQNLVNQNPTPSSSVLHSSSSDNKKNKDILVNIPYLKIISYLNSKTGKCFSYKTSSYQRVIRARWNEGKTLEDFRRVIDIKCSKWGTDPKMIDYCRPETLFGTKMDSYLNESIQSNIAPTDPTERLIWEMKKEREKDGPT